MAVPPPWDLPQSIFTFHQELHIPILWEKHNSGFLTCHFSVVEFLKKFSFPTQNIGRAAAAAAAFFLVEEEDLLLAEEDLLRVEE